MTHKFILLFIFTFVIGLESSFASDKNGAFAVKGAGIANCAQFTKTVHNQDNLLLVYGGWIEGYLSASNQHRPQTFDLAPWQSTKLMLKIAESVCAKNPDMQFYQALNAITTDMRKQRLDKAGKFIDIANDRNFIFQEEVILRIKNALKDKGLYSGDLNATYDDNLRNVMKKFQQGAHLDPTGLPDQGTLFELFKQ